MLAALGGCVTRNPPAPRDGSGPETTSPGDAATDAPSEPLACEGGRNDCDRLASNGCESDPSNDNDNCGACGLGCRLAGATAGCAMATCLLSACDPGRYNCDGVTANGCELGLPEGGQQCAADYITASCFAGNPAPDVGCSTLPASCGVARPGPVLAYHGHYIADRLDLPNPARRVRFLFAGTGGAGCQLQLWSTDGTVVMNGRSWCDGVMRQPALAVDYTAPEGEPAVAFILLQHVSNANCYVGPLTVE